MTTPLDTLDRQLIELLKVNARLPIVKLAKALGCARSTAQLRLKALEDGGIITGYTANVTGTHVASSIREGLHINGVPAAAILGTDGLLAGGPVGGTNTIIELLDDVVAEFEAVGIGSEVA